MAGIFPRGSDHRVDVEKLMPLSIRARSRQPPANTGETPFQVTPLDRGASRSLPARRLPKSAEFVEQHPRFGEFCTPLRRGDEAALTLPFRRAADAWSWKASPSKKWRGRAPNVCFVPVLLFRRDTIKIPVKLFRNHAVDFEIARYALGGRRLDHGMYQVPFTRECGCNQRSFDQRARSFRAPVFFIHGARLPI